MKKMDRNNSYYKACIAGSTVGGMAIGSTMGSAVLPGAGTLGGAGAGALWGLLAGYLSCPYVAPGIKQKIEGDLPMSEQDLFSAADAMSKYTGVRNQDDAIKLVALVKKTKAPTGTAACMSPQQAAQQVLKAT